MKSLRSLLVVGLAGGVLCAADVQVVDEIIAKVNGEIISRSELARSRKQMEIELQGRGLKGDALVKTMKERERDILRDRIDQLLLVQKAGVLSVNVDSELSKYLAEIQLQNKIADSEKFQQWIREQTGMTWEDFRAETKNGMLTQRVIRQEVGGKISIPKPELQKYYQEHKSEFEREERVFLREIFLSTEGKDEKAAAAAEKKAKALVERARKGEKFPELARDNSESQSAQQGGDIGPWKRGALDKKIEDIVFAQERNYVTDPIRTPNGFLILKVEEKHKAGLPAFEEVENEITEKLYMPLFQPRVREYLTKLRQEAFLEIKEGYVDTSAAPGKSTAWTDPAQLKPETVTKEEVARHARRKRLLWMAPIPGTQTFVTRSSKSR
ncbi:MAG: peptidylprolyl isomerase [Acidobacteria bacterium]|nr:peptidylprolyl isomerase [Acidobacteriota bacterium]